jgi:5-methylcytosine-specific restriction endonuclease McrA
MITECPKCQRLFAYVFEGDCVLCQKRAALPKEIVKFKVIGVCVYCGGDADTKDHVLPKSRGGKETLPACLRCNSAKGNMYLADFLRVFTHTKENLKYRVIFNRHFKEEDKTLLIENINKLIDKQIEQL